MEIVTISPTYRAIQKITSFLSKVYSSKLNPVYYLGSITVFLLIVDVISGIYLFFFYDVDPKKAHASVEAISSTFLGNLMRGIHRYSSDGLILFAILHMLHMILTDRFRMFRWVAWVSGVGTLFIFFIIGLSGYLLVWDQRAQLTGLLTAKFFTEVHIFGHALMSAFLGTDLKNLGGLFRILLFGHIAVTILLVFTLWVHVMRISRPRLFPPKFFMVLTTLYLIAISLIFPARSDPPADLGSIPFWMTMDWFYLTGYPLLKVLPISANWLILIGFFALLIAFPWIIRGKRNPPAQIIEEKCEGCEQCFKDCPYEAIYMKSLSENEKKAVIIENKCAGCGICIGSCNYGATAIPTIPITTIMERVSTLKPNGVVFRCPFSGEVDEGEDFLSFTVPCTGSVNAVWMRDLLKQTKGVILVGCDGPDCYFREGTRWTEERFSGHRRPRLLKNLDRGRILIIEAPSTRNVTPLIRDFLESLSKKTDFKEGPSFMYTRRVHYLLGGALFVLPFLTFYPLTTDRISFYPEDSSLAVLSFKYRSSPVKKATEVYSKLKHMQKIENIAIERSPIEVSFYANGELLHKKVYEPRGLRKDSSIYVYEEFLLPPGKYRFELIVKETAGPKKVEHITFERELEPSRTIAITYSDIRGFFPLK
jgi:quinol-cytochrome oxidoreductase complex cytochrome b subunit/coenzyme F420-reducing hydrogenase delta subunit